MDRRSCGFGAETCQYHRQQSDTDDRFVGARFKYSIGVRHCSSEPELALAGHSLRSCLSNAAGTGLTSLLKNVYRDSMTPANRHEIEAGARIATECKQLLTALVLHVLMGKLRSLVNTVEASLPPAERAHLAEGLLALRNLLADACGSEHYGFVRRFVENSSRFLDLFRNGGVSADPRVYHPLTMSPVAQMGLDASISASGLQELAIAMAVLGFRSS